MNEWKNQLYYGDNLPILREYLSDESVDLIYLDPPFNSNRNYNVLFKEESGQESAAQIMAFKDTWHWNDAASEAYDELVTGAPVSVRSMIGAMREFIGRNQMMAYIVMMTQRLIELRRVLKPSGSIYLHCDPTASHYLRIIMDTIFGADNFRNEIIWKRQSAHSDAKKKFPDIADIIFFYVKSSKAAFYPQYGKYNAGYVKKFYRFDDDEHGSYRLDNMASPNPRPNMMYEWMGFSCPEKGWRYQKETMQKLHDKGRIWYPRKQDGTLDTSRRLRLKRYLNEQEGSIITNIWTDIQPLHGVSSERLGYPTQKPLALLERIIQASSNDGDIVLDPFCGCGTAIVAAEKLNRRWIGIDITHLSIALLKYRLKKMQAETEEARFGENFVVIGEPEDAAAAAHLAESNRYQFQWWALSLIQAMPLGGSIGDKKGKKGADRGIDGLITFLEESEGKPKRILVQVKSGMVGAKDIRDLRGTIERENAAMGVFITLRPPTAPMTDEARDAGVYVSETWGRNYPKIQILTIEDLLNGAEVRMPPVRATFGNKIAKNEKKSNGVQNGMW